MISDSTPRAGTPRLDGQRSVPPTANEILAGLSREDLDALLEHAEEVEVPIRQELFEAGDRIDTVYFPLTGMISMVIVLKNGPIIEAITVGREGFTGTPLLNGVNTASYRGVCQVEGRFLAIKADAFKSALESLPDLERRLHRYAQYASDVTGQSAACNSIHTIEQRCARWLLITSDAIGATEFNLTQEFLSQMLAVRRPGVNVAMRALARRELISHRYGKVTIVDLVGLRQASCECYGTISERAKELLR
jgi:CRP-like cAMP-binding protein